MESHQVIGMVLIMAGLMDAGVMFGVVGRRVQNPATRQLVVAAGLMGSLIMIGLGIAFLAGMIGA